MSETKEAKIRRAFELTADQRISLDTIKDQLGLTTDTAAINYAVRFAARHATCAEGEIDQAIWLRNEIKRRVDDGGSLVIEKAASRTELVLPPLGEPTRPILHPASDDLVDHLKAA